VNLYNAYNAYWYNYKLQIQNLRTSGNMTGEFTQYEFESAQQIDEDNPNENANESVFSIEVIFYK